MLIFLSSLNLYGTTEASKDIILVIYISKDGKTGHVGLAIDNYNIEVNDITGKGPSVYDTVKTYSLTYFDLWGPPEINNLDHNKNLQARYYKLPRTSAEARINVGYFLNKGLPHAYDYPADALLRIRTTPTEDFRMQEIANRIQEKNDFFNSRQYNCVDYIILCLNEMFGTKIIAKEYIPFAWSSTPNKFYLEILKNLDVEVIKDPGMGIHKSFFKERILKSM